MNNIQEELKRGSKFLKKNFINTYKIDSELLLGKVLNKGREYLFLNYKENLSDELIKKFESLLKRRKKKEPVAYILNCKEFWKNNFYVDQNVLIPRPDTEILVEEIMKLYGKQKKLSILDVGTGSGCIIISILKERQKFRATAIDISKKALNIAKYNAKMHHLNNRIKFYKSSVDNFFKHKYDLIVSNPPYISKLKLKYLDKDILGFEPTLALEGGIDGFNVFSKIVKKSSMFLKIGGKLVLEIGFDQKFEMLKLLKKHNFFINKIVKDYGGRDRCVICTKL
ncbi:MAG: peptide chain release factor N(5)-glutamine methyltransferase [Candidatus Pelagibacter sp.]